MTEQHPDPGGDGAARAAQVAAVALTVAEALIRVQAQRTAHRAETDQRAAATTTATDRADRASARLAWHPGLNDRWLRGADVDRLVTAWAAAAPWRDVDPEAARVRERIEQRLAELFPEAMHRYAQGGQQGLSAAQAMGEAASLFARDSTGDDERLASAPPEGSGVATEQRPARVIVGEAYPVPVPDAVAAAASPEHRSPQTPSPSRHRAVAVRRR